MAVLGPALPAHVPPEQLLVQPSRQLQQQLQPPFQHHFRPQTMPATKFGFRRCSSHGDLRTDSGTRGPTGSSTPVQQPNFSAASIGTLYEIGEDNISTLESLVASTTDLSLALNGHSEHLRNPVGWKVACAAYLPRKSPTRRGQAYGSSYFTASIHSSASSSSSLPHHIMSIENDVQPPTRQNSILSLSPHGHKKRLSIFKRGFHRRGPSTTITAADLDPEPPQSLSPDDSRPSDSQQDGLTHPPRIALRRPSLANGKPARVSSEDTHPDPPPLNGGMNGSQSEDVMYPDGLMAPLSPRNTNRNIRWAQESGVDPPTRPRRTSSAATNGRRSSIYSKAAEGGYIGGVDAGVGSKARRLSVRLPDELIVDECPLEEHFSFVARRSNNQIGEGGAAVVKLMRSKTAGSGKQQQQVFAIKEFRPRDPDEEDEHEYQRKIKSEYAIAKALQSPNIVQTFRLCHKGITWYHVMEYCQLGDLNDLICKNYFSRTDRNCLFKQLVRGLDYLHQRGIAHRDIKSENLLVTVDGCLKIGDFGTAEVFSGPHPGVRNCRRQSLVDPDEEVRLCEPALVGSRPYMAPEVCQRLGPYDPRAVDVWSAGIVYLTLCFGGNPWDNAGRDCKNFQIYCHSWDQWAEKYPDREMMHDREVPEFAKKTQWKGLDNSHTQRMVCGMLHPDPNHRWTIREVLESKLVDLYECCQQEGYSDDIKKRQKKALHNHIPPDRRKEFKATHK